MKTFSSTNDWRVQNQCPLLCFCTVFIPAAERKRIFFSLKGVSPPLRQSGNSNLLLFTNRKHPCWKITQPLYGSIGPGLYISSPHTISRRVIQVLAYAFSELGPVSVRRKVTSTVWPPSRAAQVEATSVLAGQKKVEEANQPKPFLH